MHLRCFSGDDDLITNNTHRLSLWLALSTLLLTLDNNQI